MRTSREDLEPEIVLPSVVWCSVSQPSVVNTALVVPYDNPVYPGSDAYWDLTAHQWVCPKDGYYFLSARTETNSSTKDRMVPTITINDVATFNGAEQMVPVVSGYYSIWQGMLTHGMLKLKKSDCVKTTLFTQGAVATISSGPASTFCSIHRVLQ
jgi:hypothetical protein